MGSVNFSTSKIGCIISDKIDSNVQDSQSESYAFVLNLGDTSIRGDETIDMYKSNRPLNFSRDLNKLTPQQNANVESAEWTLVNTLPAKEGSFIAMNSQTGVAEYVLPTLSAEYTIQMCLHTKNASGEYGKEADNFSLNFVFNSPTIFVNEAVKYNSYMEDI